MKAWLANFRWKHIGIAIGVILAVLLLVDFNRRLDDLHRLSRQLDNVRASGTAVKHTQEALQTHLAYATSEEAVEEWAYRDGRWVRSGERLVILLPPAGLTPTPVSVSPSPIPVWPNWRIWWELLFGEQ